MRLLFSSIKINPKKSRYLYLYLFANITVIFLLFLLPYYLFEGRLFTGGDDTRLYYAYPNEILSNFALYSWNNISSLSYYIPNHHWFPFLIFSSILKQFINNSTQLFYFFFSANLILGFIYFQKFLKVIINKEYFISFTSAIVFVFSPITLVSLSFFLAPIWLISIFPIVGYYFLLYIKQEKFIDILKVTFWAIFLSFTFFSIPWILALIIPLFLSFLFYVLVIEKPSKKTIKSSFIFGFFIISSQLFWVIPFMMSLVSGGAISLGQKITSNDLSNSFIDTVNNVATGNIFFPFLNFYHREIVFDYDWQLKHVFINYLDHIIIFSTLFVFILFFGFLKFDKNLNNRNRKDYLFLLFTFIILLYFFTVNIGFLKNIFLFLGNIPGFGIFKNFTDKFALAYIFIYSIIFALSLVVVKKATKFYLLVVGIVIAIVFINLLPIKQIIVSPLWKTNNIYTTNNFPNEYLSFTQSVKSKISNDNFLISYPQNITAYAVIAEENDINAYIGTSPFKFFTGINDLGGKDSYHPVIGEKIEKLTIEREYDELLELFDQLNIGYALKTNNIPQEVKKSYLYNDKYLKAQDKELFENIFEKEILSSRDGNYVVYKLKNSPAIITVSSDNAKVEYEKLNPIAYKIIVKNLNSDTKLNFKETFHPGWKLYLKDNNEDSTHNVFMNPLRNSIFNESHKVPELYGNEWKIDYEQIKKQVSGNYYTENKDDSIDVEFYLFFYPQNYFILSILITVFLLFIGSIFLVIKEKNEKK